MPIYYFTRLNGPRPTFPMDMTAQEREVMEAHVAYWGQLTTQGKTVVYGPVMDPKGPFGMGVLCVEDEAELKHLLADDPVTKASLGSYEYHAMRAVVPGR